MPKNKDFALRIEVLDECLRNRQRKWTLEKLVDEVNCKLNERYNKTTSKRTIQNDIKYLIEEKNAPIKKKKDGNSNLFYYTDSTYSIKNLPIDQEEIDLLKDAISILSQINEFQILGDIEIIIDKLQHTLKTNANYLPSYIQFEKHTIALGTNYIDNIFSAIKGEMPLRISYQSFNALKPDSQIFHPYLLKEYRNRWFLICRRENSTTITTLALDRIKSLKNSDADFIPNNLFDVGTYFNNLIGVTMPSTGQIKSIELKVHSRQSPYIKTKPIHNTQKIVKEYKNGDIKIQIDLICNYELRSVLLSYGCDIEIIKPEELRNEMKDVFKNALLNYK